MAESDGDCDALIFFFLDISEVMLPMDFADACRDGVGLWEILECTFLFWGKKVKKRVMRIYYIWS